MSSNFFKHSLKLYAYLSRNGYKHLQYHNNYSNKAAKPSVATRKTITPLPNITAHKVVVSEGIIQDLDTKSHHSIHSIQQEILEPGVRFTRQHVDIDLLPIDVEITTLPNAVDLGKKDGFLPSELRPQLQKIELSELHKHYMGLSKFRLTTLVVATTLGGYCMAPGFADPTTLALALLGTGLTSCSASTINQFLEVPFDSQMPRTRNRVLVRKKLTPLHAATFALVTGTLGIATLALGVNSLTACLGATNLILYTCVYTPMKQISIVNTWIGSIVGAIPPVMGWTALTGTIDPGALVLGGILYCWQFPHFNALSWTRQSDYSRAGYRMMSVTHPDLCRKTALRYSFGLLGLCMIAPWADLTTIEFPISTLPLNLYFLYKTWHFYYEPNSKTSSSLFRLSLIYLPLVLMVLWVCKKRDPAFAKKKPKQIREEDT